MSTSLQPAYYTVLLSLLLALAVDSHQHGDQNPSSSAPHDVKRVNNAGFRGDKSGFRGKRWAVLVAGSRYYYNYRHQADVCHAYQVLRKGGLKDENIIVFMYDDIAFDPENPRPGIIINKPHGKDVYKGVPKDYTGDDVNAKNFLAVLLGNKTALTGGSRKVVKSSPHDHIFIYYADHGSPGFLNMPSEDDVRYAKDFIDALKAKHRSGTYKSMVIYVEACEAGSIFEGLLPKDLNIFAVTASNSEQSSWATYCPGDNLSAKSEYDTCLGDLFSVAWIENSESHHMSKETLRDQYNLVRRRTKVDETDNERGSNVKKYGSLRIQKELLVNYIGSNPSTNDFMAAAANSTTSKISNSSVINQRDADLHYFQRKIQNAPKNSQEYAEAREKLANEMSRRTRIDRNINQISSILFGQQDGQNVLTSLRPTGQPLVDDWSCFKTLVTSFKKYCGASSSYGMKYSRVLANMCNMGRPGKEKIVSVMAQVCA